MSYEFKHKNIAFFTILVLIGTLFYSFSCGPSYEEQQAKKEIESDELIKKKEKIIMQLVQKHNAVNFPPKKLSSNAYTYELQQYFKLLTQEPIMFEGSLEDIEQDGDEIIIEFLCPVGRYYFLNKKAIRFKLSISGSSIGQFLNEKRKDTSFLPSRYLHRPDYYVVAKIDNIKSYRLYEFDGKDNGDNVELSVDVIKNHVATGNFIEALAIP
ncbi:MAG: hypothetical protein OEV64_01895 [Desulfobulbaceae bacterium]|nr:hypothetical protein [Desulfobulbaceae bacterium]